MASLDAGRLIKGLQQLQALPEPAPVAYAISNTAANQKSEAATIESIKSGINQATPLLQIDSMYQIQQIKNIW